MYQYDIAKDEGLKQINESPFTIIGLCYGLNKTIESND